MAKAKRRKVTKIDVWTEGLNRRLTEAVKEVKAGSASHNRGAGDSNLPADPMVELESRRHDLEQGDKLALLDAIAVCAQHGLPMPAWASTAFLAAHDRVLNQKIGNWDKVFGTPLKRARHLRLKRRREIDYVQVMVSLMLARQEGRPLGGELFDEIGDRLGLSKTVVSDIYYEGPRRKIPETKQVSGEFRKTTKNLRYKKR